MQSCTPIERLPGASFFGVGRLDIVALSQTMNGDGRSSHPQIKILALGRIGTEKRACGLRPETACPQSRQTKKFPTIPS
jgi:hypothetical protein